MKRRAAISETVGAVAIYTAAVFLHFVNAFGGGALGLVFGAVNESVWEHVKIFSFAYVGWALLQLCWLRVPFRTYAVAKCVGLYVLMGGMIAFFYAYTAFAGRSILAVDILSSLVLVILVQALSWLPETQENRLGELFIPAMLLMLLYYLMFFSFTVFAPRLPLFRDPITGGYGIPTAYG